MDSYIFGCNDVAIKVESNNKDLIKGLIQLYGDYYSDNNVEPSITIRYIENNIPKYYMIKDKENQNESYNYINYYEKNNILYVSFDKKYNKDKLQFVQRIFCNVFILEFQRKGYSIIHGACVSKFQKTVIISGNKGSGKTTTLLKLLEQGYDFVSNDKVAIKEVGDSIVTCGIPHSMGIVKDDISKYNINKALGRVDGNKVYFKVAELKNIFNVKVYNKGYLNSILFPNYEKGRQVIEIIDCENNFLQLGDNNIFKEDAVAPQKQYLVNLIKQVNYIEPTYLNNIPGYIVKQGEETFEQLDYFINSKLEKGKCKCLR